MGMSNTWGYYINRAAQAVIMCTGKCTMYFDVNVHVDASAVCTGFTFCWCLFYLVLVWAELAHSLLLMQ